MKTFLFTALVVLLSIIHFPVFVYAGTVIIQGDVNINDHWKAGNEYVVTEDVTISEGVHVVVDPGTHITLRASLSVFGSMEMIGTLNSPIVVKSDGGDSKMWTVLFQPERSLQLSHVHFEHIKQVKIRGVDANIKDVQVIDTQGGISLVNSSTTIESSAFKGSYTDGVYIQKGSFVINNSAISGNKMGVRLSSGPVLVRTLEKIIPIAHAAESCGVVSNSSIYENLNSGIESDGYCKIDAKNNWWGDSSGPRHETYNPTGLGNGIDAWDEDVSFSPWLIQAPGVVEVDQECCSNVLFLPGIQSSRLYTRLLFSEDTLWEPGHNGDVKKLFLTTEGSSIQSNIYTRDIVDVISPVPMYEDKVYKSFADTLDRLVIERKIGGWFPYAYDWRYSVDQVGTSEDIVHTFLSLASTSINNKVSIVAHSNGGLVAKYLVSELIRLGHGNKIDGVVFVAVPHLGTPQALGALLHSDGQQYGGGLILSKSTARGLTENMVSVMGLLPSKEFFNHTNATLDFSLQTHGFTKSKLTTYDDIQSFILGSNGRIIPSDSDTYTPNVISRSLKEKSDAIQSFLTSWKPPSSIRSISIVGVNAPTSEGITYFDGSQPSCAGLVGECKPVKFLDHKTIYTPEGDGTVLTASAEGFASTTIYVDLFAINERDVSNIKHYNILESKDVLKTVSSFILGTSTYIELPEHVSYVMPELKQYVSVSVHSPVAISIGEGAIKTHVDTIPTDPGDTEMWFVNQKFPNSTYEESGEGKYLLVPKNTTEDISISGTGYGTFDVKIASGSYTQEFRDIPVQPELKAKLSMSGGNSNTPTIQIDTNGDGVFESRITPQSKIPARMYLLILKTKIQLMNINRELKSVAGKIIDSSIKKYGNSTDKKIIEKVTHITEFLNKNEQKLVFTSVFSLFSGNRIGWFEAILKQLENIAK
jgi:pimeloyl-ACP methyl ester carboxylesterase